MDKTAIEWFQLIQDFTDKLTAKRIFTTLLFGLLVTFTMMLYENRDFIFHKAYSSVVGEVQPSSWTVGDETKQQMLKFVSVDPNVNLVMITEMDLQKNRRLPRFWHIEASTLVSTQFLQKIENLLPQPVFDYDAKNTTQLVAVLNNEFVCSRTSDTIFQRIFPFIIKEVPVVCRLAIPPFYGRFVGIITIGLTTYPTKSELDALRLEVARYAVEIYLRDIIKKSVHK